MGASGLDLGPQGRKPQPQPRILIRDSAFRYCREVGLSRQTSGTSSPTLDQPVLNERFEELSGGFLRGFSHRKAQACRNDLDHVRTWLSPYGQACFRQNDLLLFWYLLMLTRRGYNPSTIRRRSTCLRAFVVHASGCGEVSLLGVHAAAERVRLTM